MASRKAGSAPDLRAVLKKGRWTSSDARAVLAAHRGSGLSLTAFARQRGLQVQRLILWRKRLAILRPTEAVAPQRFVPVVVTSRSEPAAIEVVLRGGHRVHVRDGFDAAVLARVIEVLEHKAC